MPTFQEFIDFIFSQPAARKIEGGRGWSNEGPIADFYQAQSPQPQVSCADFAHKIVKKEFLPLFDKLNLSAFSSYGQLQAYLREKGYREAKKMKFEQGKTYNTVGGDMVVTILTNEINNPNFPIVGVCKWLKYDNKEEHVAIYTAEGERIRGCTTHDDLTTEYSPFQRFKFGDLVVVSDEDDEQGLIRMFAGVSSDGKAQVYNHSRDKHKITWNYCSLLNIEKLKEQN